MADVPAWVPIVTLVGGYAGSLATEIFRDWRQEARDVRVRRADSEGERARRNADFQRATLLDLQEALFDFMRGSTAYFRARAPSVPEDGETLVDAKPSPEDAELRRLAAARATVLVVRVQDDDLRTRVRALKDRSGAMMNATTLPDLLVETAEATSAFNDVNERIGELLRDAE